MTQFGKAHWIADDKRVRMDVAFSKVNKEKRQVSGWATLDNIDTQNDIVLAEASARAFSRARGNLREMHDKKAVGRLVSFKEDVFRTPDGKQHKGIFVTAYVSKGAQDTWEKVLDGTLSGFSIGGSINESEEDFNKDANATVRVIKDYDLTELSLVDNPGNQLANVFSIEKLADGSVTVRGMAADVDTLNVFYCNTDEIVSENTDDLHKCPVCEEDMVNIGWVENGSDRNEKVNELVTKYLSPDEATALSKGGDDVAKKETETTDESVATGHEEGDPTEIPSPTVPADDESASGTGAGTEVVDEVPSDEPVEKAVDVDEVHDEGEEISKKISELKDVVTKSLEGSRSETKQQIKELEAKIEILQKSFVEKASELDSRFAELDEKFEVAKSRLAGFEKSLDKINSGQAFRKSVDSDEETVVEQINDPWQGSAFSVRSLLR